MPNKKTQPLPEIRQCTDPEHALYGAVAVATTLGSFKWAVMHPQYGGHWAGDDEVKNWPTAVPEAVSA